MKIIKHDKSLNIIKYGSCNYKGISLRDLRRPCKVPRWACPLVNVEHILNPILERCEGAHTGQSHCMGYCGIGRLSIFVNTVTKAHMMFGRWWFSCARQRVFIFHWTINYFHEMNACQREYPQGTARWCGMCNDLFQHEIDFVDFGKDRPAQWMRWVELCHARLSVLCPFGIVPFWSHVGLCLMGTIGIITPSACSYPSVFNCPNRGILKQTCGSCKVFRRLRLKLRLCIFMLVSNQVVPPHWINVQFDRNASVARLVFTNLDLLTKSMFRWRKSHECLIGRVWPTTMCYS